MHGQISFILSGSLKKRRLIAAWRLGLWAPLVACNNFKTSYHFQATLIYFSFFSFMALYTVLSNH